MGIMPFFAGGKKGGKDNENHIPRSTAEEREDTIKWSGMGFCKEYNSLAPIVLLPLSFHEGPDEGERERERDT